MKRFLVLVLLLSAGCSTPPAADLRGVWGGDRPDDCGRGLEPPSRLGSNGWVKWRSTNRNDWPRVPRKVLELGHFGGFTLVHLRALEVTEPLTVTCCDEHLTVMDTGYRWLTLLEPGARHITTVHCDAAGRPVQLYVDIIEAWELGPDGFPRYGDLYLDVIALPDGVAEIIDGEELELALSNGRVTQEQYALAWAEARTVYAAICAGTFRPIGLALRGLELFIR